MLFSLPYFCKNPKSSLRYLVYTYGKKRCGGFSISSLFLVFAFILFRFCVMRCCGYPFFLKTFHKYVISCFVPSLSHTLHALSSRHFIVPYFTRGWWCEKNGVYLTVLVGFFCTVVVNLSFSPLIRMSRKRILLLFSSSVVNLSCGCCLFRCKIQNNKMSGRKGGEGYVIRKE